MVSRRQALRIMSSSTLIVALAGCTSRLGSNPGDSSKPTVSFSAEVLNSFSPDQPGRIRLQFKNETDSMLLYLTQESDGQRGLFRPVKGTNQSSSAELLLLQSGAINCQTEERTPSAIPDTPTDKSDGEGCWRSPCEELIIYSYNPTWEELRPDTPWRAEYVLLDGFNDACLPAGKYDFNAAGRIAKGHLTDNDEFQFDSGKFRVVRRLTVTINDDLEVSTTTDVSVTELDSSG